nr:helix-turn-helix transcriptional regulator [Vibrio vulnificus]
MRTFIVKNDVGVASIVVGKKIKEIRKKKALTIQELAEISGVSEGHISRLENGLKSPTISTLEKLANALDVPIVYFFSLL